MPRKTLLLVLLALALVEAGVLATGIFGRHKPELALTRPVVGLQDRAVPDSVRDPTLYLEAASGQTWLSSLIGNVKATLDTTLYELTDPTVTTALVQACQRGVKARVLLDQRLERAANTPAYNQLAAAGPHCAVAWSNLPFEATHQKTFILDGNKAVVLSFDLTPTAYADRGIALLDTDTADLRALQTTFDADFKAIVDDAEPPLPGHNLIWAPTTAQDDLVSFIDDARTTLLVEAEELSAASIVHALAGACHRGVKVTLAMNATSPGDPAVLQELEMAGCSVHTGTQTSNSPHLHANAMVADAGTANAIGYVGSIRFSSASMTQTRDLGLYLHDPSAIAELGTALTAEYIGLPALSTGMPSPHTRPARP